MTSSPLCRSMIGVDRMADLVETAMRRGPESGYPAYDMAVRMAVMLPA